MLRGVVGNICGMLGKGLVFWLVWNHLDITASIYLPYWQSVGVVLLAGCLFDWNSYYKE